MKNFSIVLLTLFVAFLGIPNLFAGPQSTYKYQISLEDEYGEPITSGAVVYVKVPYTNTNKDATGDASIWTTQDTTSGTYTGTYTVPANGNFTFYATGTVYDIHVSYYGKQYILSGATPGGQKLITLSKTMHNRDNINGRTLSIDDQSRLTIPIGGDFFRVVEGSGASGISEFVETGHTVGERIMLLFASDTQIGCLGGTAGSGASWSTNFTIPILRYVDKAADVGAGPRSQIGTLFVGTGSLLELVYDGTIWRILAQFTS